MKVTIPAASDTSRLLVAAVFEVFGEVDGGVGEFGDVSAGQEGFEAFGVGGPGGGVAHHDLEELYTVGAGDQRAQRGAVGELDVGAGGAVGRRPHMRSPLSTYITWGEWWP